MNTNGFCTRLLLAMFLLFGIQSFARAVPYTFTTIDVPGALSTFLSGINNAGQIVGSSATVQGFTASSILAAPSPPSTFRVPRLPVPATSTTPARSWGAFFDSIGTHGFLNVGGTTTTIDVPGAEPTTFASGINNADQIVGFFADPDGWGGLTAFSM